MGTRLQNSSGPKSSSGLANAISRLSQPQLQVQGRRIARAGCGLLGQRFEALGQFRQPLRTVGSLQMSEQPARLFELLGDGRGVALGPPAVDPVLPLPILLDHRPEVEFGNAGLTGGGLQCGDGQVAVRSLGSGVVRLPAPRVSPSPATPMTGDPAGQRLQSHQRRAGVGPQGYTAEPERSGLPAARRHPRRRA